MPLHLRATSRIVRFMIHPSSPHIAATAADRPSRCGSALTGAPAHPPAYVVGRGFFICAMGGQCDPRAEHGLDGGLCIPVAQHHVGIPLDGVAGSTPASRSSLSRLETGRSTARPRGGASVVGSIPTIRAESKSAASGNRRTELVRYSSDGGERPAPYSGRQKSAAF